ncbi:MAG: methyltransferase domain-containing protein [Actinomycetota bacterium]
MRTPPNLRAAIVAYYEQTWFDYRLVWTRKSHLGMHFGYWDADTKSQAESVINTNRLVEERIRPRPGELLLDAGCGVGGTAFWLAARHRVRVLGITLSPTQARRARRYAALRGLRGRVRFMLQDAMETAFAAGTFDAVYAIESSNYAPDKRAWLEEAYRILKPGGRLVVVDGFQTPRRLTPAEKEFQQSWLWGFAIPHLCRLDDFAGWAADLGFERVRAENRMENFRPSCRRLRRITFWLYPAAALLHALGIRSDVQHGNVRAAWGLWTALRRDLWFYGILSAVKGG